jgi:glyoxylase-like metal-dependent hydrolase (beta-lactamase superfamily II)
MKLRMAWPILFLLGAQAIRVGPVEAQDEAPFRIERLAEGVHAGLVNPLPPMYVFANALIVVGDDGVLVVDTHASPSATRAMIAHVRALTDKPVKYLINTHWHGDHVYGNATYRDAFPGVQIIASAGTAEDVRTAGKQMLRDELAELPPSIAERDQWLETGRGPNGQELTETDRARIARSRRLRQGQVDELRSLELLPPEGLVQDSLTLRLGRREVRLYHVGPAHTRGDLIVWLPAERVLAVGDLLEEGVPYAGHGYPAGWVRALERIEALDSVIIVPSHGGVQRDRALLDAQLGLFRDLVSVTRTLHCGGSSGESTVEQAVALLMRREPKPAVAPAALEEFLREAVRRALDEAEAEGERACRKYQA